MEEAEGVDVGGYGGCCLINEVVGEELLTEIVIRLPLDLIFRCKSVCKRWLSLIEDPLIAAYYTKKKKKKQRQRQSRRSSRLSCHLNVHPQHRSPILIPINGGKRKRLTFSLGFVPAFAQLHGATNYNDLLQRAADDKKNKKKQKLILGTSNGLLIIKRPVLPDDHLEKKKKKKKKVISNEPPSFYTTRDLILGSSNGLLLCAPLLCTPPPSTAWRTKSVPVFDDFPAIYVVCNPHTKQWLQVPPSPPFPSSHSIFPHAANVGFVSGFDSAGGCWFKIVRLAPDFKSPSRRSLTLQVFSPQSWEWTLVTLSRPLPGVIGPDDSTLPVVAMTVFKKNGNPNLCWMLNGTHAIIYDPVKNVVDHVIGVIQPTSRTVVPEVVVMDAMCVSKNWLWGGRIHNGLKLEIYMASRKGWKMVKEFDMMKIYNPEGRYVLVVGKPWDRFLSMKGSS